MVVSVAFSGVIYQVLSREVERFARAQRFRIERGLPEPRVAIEVRATPSPQFMDVPLGDPDLVAESKQRIVYTLVVINGIIFVLAGGLGYILAGQTLLPIRKMLDEQSRFISDASHELKTPITAIKSMMEVEMRNPSMTVMEAKEALTASVSEMNKLQKLTQSLLELAQSEGKDAWKTTPVSLMTVLKDAKDRVRIVSKNKSITIILTGVDVIVRGSMDRLTDAIVILLDNAIKYSNAKTKITATVKLIKGYGKILIADHGVGIAEKDLPFIFDRFYRGDVSRSKADYDGYGLGLPIAKQIIQLHNGSIDVESKKQKGTTVTVSIPVSKAS